MNAKKRGFMCRTDFEWEFFNDHNGLVFPTKEAAAGWIGCGPDGVIEVEVTLVGGAGFRNHFGLSAYPWFGPGFMMRSAWEAEFAGRGTLVYSDLYDAWRSGLPGRDRVVDVDVRFIRLAVAPLRRVFVYEEIYRERGLVHQSPDQKM